MADTIEAGWYPHPTNRALERYWDGADWTNEVRYPVRHDVPGPVQAAGGGLPLPAVDLSNARRADEVFNPQKGKVNPRLEADRRARAAYSGVKSQAKGYAAVAPSNGEGSARAISPDDMSLPYPGASPGIAFSRFWKGWAQFSGRASRSEYWWSFLFAMLISIIPLVGLLTIVPSIAVGVRRLHDSNRSGLWLLLPIGVNLVASIAAGLLITTGGADSVGLALGLFSVLSFGATLAMIWLLVAKPNPEGARFD